MPHSQPPERGPPADSRMGEMRLVRVFSSSSIPEGLLAKGLLEAEGIPVTVKGESEGPYRMGPIDLWVPEEFELQARELLARASE